MRYFSRSAQKRAGFKQSIKALVVGRHRVTFSPRTLCCDDHHGFIFLADLKCGHAMRRCSNITPYRKSTTLLWVAQKSRPSRISAACSYFGRHLSSLVTLRAEPQQETFDVLAPCISVEYFKWRRFASFVMDSHQAPARTPSIFNSAQT